MRVRRDGAQIFARKGYLAVRRPAGGALGYESAALALLDRGKPPNDFPVSAQGFVFPAQKGISAVPIVAHVKTRDLRFHIDEARGTYTAEAVIVARIRNAGGQTLQTLSQQYQLTGAPKDADVARQGEILFYLQPELQPGVYGLEVIVHDALAERASARLSTLSVPSASASHVPASTLVLIERVERVASTDRKQDLPFYYGDMLLYPNPGDPLHHGRDTELTFYFSLFKRAGDDPAVTLEILHSGLSLASMPIELPKPVPDGRVQHVGKLPIDKFPSGTYELRLRVRAGNGEETRNAFFTIADK